MTANVANQKAFAPFVQDGAHVSNQKVFVTLIIQPGARVSRQTVFAPIYDAGAASTRRRQAMLGSF